MTLFIYIFIYLFRDATLAKDHTSAFTVKRISLNHLGSFDTARFTIVKSTLKTMRKLYVSLVEEVVTRNSRQFQKPFDMRGILNTN